ncbi:hypothetical protein HOV30_gp049 [Erwinia phage Derbicus]|uniref:Uncharacterized protein n=2 Tax=Derbicusvirus derbicus TaxID=2734104 RepID=A0A482IDG0_9CAUD|nr:hypothetical protein BIZ82_gp049 [Erwinia phage vB_EamM_EarlPhillipIV]YP_009821093.1 hypothetical protein HOV30_gp049 [Erwinia phage Derbicus]ANZ48899.1 hypothetical protein EARLPHILLIPIV_49 [Erwinia phage vB_EamM_EarlPhillipIV]QBP07475.1 hypothetical protein DERBICUS_49 [Erwinia phage Derbicus]
MTGTTGLVANPMFRLGQLGELARQEQATELKTAAEVIDFLKRTDVVAEQNMKVLQALDEVMAEIRSYGLNQDTFVAVESIRPGTIPAAVRGVLTSNYSRTHREETLVALESYSQVGKYGILLLLIGAVIKILGWIVGNASAAAGGEGSGADDYKSEADGRTEGASLGDGSILESLKSSSVRDGYVSVFESAKDEKAKKALNDVAAILDARVQEVQGENYFNNLSAAATGGKSFFGPILRKAVAGDISQREATLELITQVVATGAPSAIFNDRAAQSAWAALPKGAKECGVRFATGSLFKRYANNLNNLNGDAQRFEKTLDSVMSNLLKDAGADQRDAQNLAHEFITEVSTVSAAVFSMLERDSSGNPTMSTELSSVGYRIKPDFAKKLIGYTEATGTTGSYEFRYVTSSAFMCSELLVDLVKDSGMSDTDHPSLLRSLVMLGPDDLESNPRTDIEKYSALQKRFQALYEKFDEFGKKFNKTGKNFPMFVKFEENIFELISKNQRDATFGKDTGLFEVGAASEGAGSSFFKGAKAVMAVCRDFAKVGGALTKVVDRHNKCPWTKAKK